MRFQTEQLYYVNVASNIGWGHLMKDRICSQRGKFFPLRADSFFGRALSPGEQIDSQENLHGRQMAAYPCT